MLVVLLVTLQWLHVMAGLVRLVHSSTGGLCASFSVSF
jgi:hypothetical protein